MSTAPTFTNAKRTGFTAVELLVTIAIIGMLISISLPSVQRAREAARRMTCQTNLRQLALATLQFESAFQRFPIGVSHKVELLPFLEQSALREQLVTRKGDSPPGMLPNIFIEGFVCPSDSGQTSSETHFDGMQYGSSYQGNAGNGVLAHGFNGIFGYEEGLDDYYPSRRVRVADILDGLSNTAAFAECQLPGGGPARLSEIWVSPLQYFNPQDLESLAADCDSMPLEPAQYGYQTLGLPRGTPWHGGSMGIALYTHTLQPNRPSCSNKSEIITGIYTASSMHGGGINVAFADGHVKFVSQSVDSNVWVDLGSRESSAHR
jgi:prepilin-type processing-associated H-X9-DG protein/prepilin-type N-terminal cleavage/methylation domain-containing protein